MRLVIKIGGSMSIDENGPRMEYFKKLLPVLEKIDESNQLILSIGGGKFIRKYYDAIKEFGLSDEEMEWIAIDILRVNVRFLSFLVKKKVILSLDELKENSSGVIGGIAPKRSTDANAAYAAKTIKADLFIKLTNVDGVYDKDPRKFIDAKKIDEISFNELKNYTEDGKPGKYGVLDNMAADTIVKNRIKTVIMNGSEPKDILKVLRGEKIGTLISD
ncbi:MAG: hypothetical protein V1900_02555 [Candidatus Aenigmatarchaeota archaeon]